MAINNFGFDDVDVSTQDEGFKKSSTYPNPTTEAETRRQLQMPLSQIRKWLNDNVVGNINNFILHIANVTNPHSVTKAQVGLGNVDNTSDTNKPVSTAQQTAIDAVQSDVDSLEETVNSLSGSLTTHKNNKNNPHSVTKTQIGLSNVDNTSDLNKPVSTATQTAIDTAKANAIATAHEEASGINNTLVAHKTNSNNPHFVTANQVGLGNVDNTSDLNKPVSNATQNALNGKENVLTAGSNITIDRTNPSAPVISSTGGGGSSDYNDLTNKPKIDGVTLSGDKSWSDLGISKGDVGLGNVDNTSDLSKPVSTATQTALNGKENTLTAGSGVSIDRTNPSAPVISATGSGGTTDYEQLTNKPKIDGVTLSGDKSWSDLGINKSDVGLGNADNTSDLNKPISTATQTALNAKENSLSAGNNITIDRTNPASPVISADAVTDYDDLSNRPKIDGVTLTGNKSWSDLGINKTDVGLGNVDNTSDLNKPISTATQTALNGKQATLVSGTNIKTVNGVSILGSGNIGVNGAVKHDIVSSLLIPQALSSYKDWDTNEYYGYYAVINGVSDITENTAIIMMTGKDNFLDSISAHIETGNGTLTMFMHDSTNITTGAFTIVTTETA